MIDVDELRARVVGHTFPEGSFTIPEYEAWLTADAVLSPPLPPGVAHPMYVYYAGLVGMGLSLDELFALVGSSAAEGPMFGEARLEIGRPLRVGETVAVRGTVTDVVRKSGARAGTFDIVTFRLELVDERGESAGAAVNSFVFPRRS
jgi:acyl dehydratase